MKKQTKIIFEIFVFVSVIFATILICQVFFEPEVVVKMSGASLYYDENGNTGQSANDYTFQNENIIKEVPDEIIKVNINTADKDKLMCIPEVGEKMAEKIIEYRKSKSFESIEEIKNIDGIGDKKFESMKDYIIIE